MGDLSPSQISGGFAVTSDQAGTVVARVPANAQSPSQLSVLNTHATATIYAKWVPLSQTGTSFPNSDAGVVLTTAMPGYTWDSVPRNAMLVLRSTVNGAVAAVEGNWLVPVEAQLL